MHFSNINSYFLLPPLQEHHSRCNKFPVKCENCAKMVSRDQVCTVCMYNMVVHIIMGVTSER